jgi:hypothetical protein
MAKANTRTEALRALKRQISDEVFRRLLHDEQTLAASGNVSSSAAA